MPWAEALCTPTSAAEMYAQTEGMRPGEGGPRVAPRAEWAAGLLSPCQEVGRDDARGDGGAACCPLESE